MADLYEIKEAEERVILIAVSVNEEDDTAASLDELEELVKTAGAFTVGKVIQNRERIHPGTYLGKGKIEEVKELLWELNATGVVCDDELSPAQMRNLEDALDTKVMDRTMVILDIFASRATTSEGKIQVELAQLKYRAARLVGLRSSLSRLGGGIGTRGPGEKKLEMDRRLIHERISQLKSELETVKRHRDVIRKQREKQHTPVAAIVGYTNAGKSTLLNRLTDAGILAEDKLFATLDPTSRALKLPNGVSVMLIDTVGLVRRLPHHLVEAFHSTLEEAALADMILNVCDASSPEAQVHLEVTRKLLADLGCTGRPVIPVMNKCDLVPSLLDIPMIGNAVRISAKTGEGIGDLLAAVEENLPVSLRRVCLLLPFDQAGLVAQIRKDHVLYQEEYRPDGIFVSALLDPVLYGRVREYEILENT